MAIEIATSFLRDPVYRTSSITPGPNAKTLTPGSKYDGLSRITIWPEIDSYIETEYSIGDNIVSEWASNYVKIPIDTLSYYEIEDKNLMFLSIRLVLSSISGSSIDTHNQVVVGQFLDLSDARQGRLQLNGTGWSAVAQAYIGHDEDENCWVSIDANFGNAVRSGSLYDIQSDLMYIMFTEK